MYAETSANRAGISEVGAGPVPAAVSPGCGPDGAAPSAGNVLSPSLQPWTPGTAPAFEMKFLLDEDVSREVEGRLAWRLTPDPHGDPALSHAYRISSIYCDTPALDVYHRIGRHRHVKFRLRRYGDESVVFLERKTKRGVRVRKRRAAVDLDELARLSSVPTDREWAGSWFHQQLHARRMSPACAVHYLRTAYIGAGIEGSVRLTFDRHLRTSLVETWELPPAADGKSVLEGSVICEFKFRGAMPLLFKEAIRDLTLKPGGVSKYRNCFRAAGGRAGEELTDA